MIFCGSGATGRDRQADRDPRTCGSRPISTTATACTAQIPPERAPGRLHRAVRAPLQRAAVARVDRRRRRDRRGRRRPHRPRRARGAARRARRPPAQDRLVLRRQQRHRHRLEHRARSPPAAPATARSRSGTSRPPRRTSRSSGRRRAATTPAHKDAIFLSPAQVHRRPGHAGRAGRAPLAAHEPRARRCPAAARSPTSTPSSTRYLDRPGRTARRAARPAIVESIRAGLVFQLKEAVGARRDPRRTRTTSSAARSPPGATTPRSRCSATSTPTGCRSSRSSSGAVAERRGSLPPPQLRRRAAERPVRHPGPRRLLVRRPVRPSPARHRPRPLARVREPRSRTAARASSPAGCASTSTTSSPRRCSTTSIEAVEIVASDGWRLLHDYRFDPVTGLWHHRNGPIEPPMRLAEVRYEDGEMRYPQHHDRAPEEALAGLPRSGPRAAAQRAAATCSTRRPPCRCRDGFEQLRWFELPPCCLAAARELTPASPMAGRHTGDPAEPAATLVFERPDRPGRRRPPAGPLMPTQAHDQPFRAVSPSPNKEHPLHRILHRRRPGHLPGHRPAPGAGCPRPGRRLLPRRRGAHPAPRRGGRRARRRARPGRHPPRRLRAGRPARDGTRSRALDKRDAAGPVPGRRQSIRSYHAICPSRHPPMPSTSSSGTTCSSSRSSASVSCSSRWATHTAAARSTASA